MASTFIMEGYSSLFFAKYNVGNFYFKLALMDIRISSYGKDSLE